MVKSFVLVGILTKGLTTVVTVVLTMAVTVYSEMVDGSSL
jgi:hypothetical protein